MSDTLVAVPNVSPGGAVAIHTDAPEHGLAWCQATVIVPSAATATAGDWALGPLRSAAGPKAAAPAGLTRAKAW